jgi:hypothetical protein
VKSDLEKPVPVHDVVTVAVLDCQHGAFHVGRVGVDIEEVHAGGVTSARQKDLAVVKRQFPHPVQKRQAVGAFRGVRDPVALAAPAASAMLRDRNVAVRRPFLSGELAGIDPLVLNVRIAMDDDRAFHAGRGHRAERVQLDAVRHGHHFLEIAGGGASGTNGFNHPHIRSKRRSNRQ